MLAVAGPSSCSKEEGAGGIPSAEAHVELTVSGENLTKASGSGHGNQSDDNTVNTIDVLLFDAAGNLERHVRSTDGNSCSFAATVGRKSLYVIVNNHDVTLVGATTLARFKALKTSLKKEALKSFTMIGSKDVTLVASNSINVPVHRLCARIRLSGLGTDFSGTPYAGATLDDVKVYMLNAHASCLVWNGSDPSEPVILNHRAYSSVCNEGVSMDGILQSAYPRLEDGFPDASIHYFYPYANVVSSETHTQRYTRLTVEGILRLGDRTFGKRYWSVNINREGFGYVSGVKGVEANRSYTMDIVIKNAGYPDPDIVPEERSVDVTLGVEPWAVVTDRHEF